MVQIPVERFGPASRRRPITIRVSEGGVNIVARRAVTGDSRDAMQDKLPNTFQGLIGLWPSTRAFGRELVGDPERGRIFHRRNRVPKRYWSTMEQIASKRGLVGVDFEYLARLYKAGKNHGR